MRSTAHGAGPTIVTAPFMFDDIWELAGRKREDYFEMVECQPYYRIFDSDRRSFDYNRDESFILEQIQQRSPGDVEGYKKFIASTKPIFEKGFLQLADKPFHKFTDMLKVAPDLVKMQSYLSVYQYVSKFVKDDFLRRVFSFHPLLIGGNPFDSPSIYAMIHYLERQWGVWFAMGGTGSIVKAFERLFTELGGKIHLNADVAEITIDPEKRRANGIRMADGTVHKADGVVVTPRSAGHNQNLIAPQFRRSTPTASWPASSTDLSLL